MRKLDPGSYNLQFITSDFVDDAKNTNSIPNMIETSAMLNIPVRKSTKSI